MVRETLKPWKSQGINSVISETLEMSGKFSIISLESRNNVWIHALKSPTHILFMLWYCAVLQITAGQRSITTNFWPLTAHIYHVMIIVTSGFSNKSFFIIIFRSSRMQMFFKNKCYWKFCNIHRKISLCWSLFLIKFQTACDFVSTLSQKRLQHRWFP